MKLCKKDRKSTNKWVVSTGYACVVAELVNNDDEPSLLLVKSFCCKRESDQYFILLKGKSFDDLSSTISTDFEQINRSF